MKLCIAAILLGLILWPFVVIAKPTSIRDNRPIALSASILGKTPIAGGLVEINLWPYTAIGTGLGYFQIQKVSGTILPVYVRAYALPWNISPYIDLGLGFLSVTFSTDNSLLNSNFTGIQTLMAVGGEWRDDSGFLARLEMVRYFNAKVWIPGASIGFAFDMPNASEAPTVSKNRARPANP